MKHSLVAQAAYIDTGDAPAKQAILGAALALFAERGIDGTSIRDIGAAAGFTNPALFRHFAGKDALALYLFDKIFQRFRSTLPAIDDRPFTLQLRDAVAAYLAFFDADLKAALYFQENLRRLWPQLPDSLRKRSLIAHFHALLKVGVAQKVVSSDDDPRLLISLLAGFLGQLARQLYFREIPGPARTWIDAVHVLALRGLSMDVKRSTHSSARSSGRVRS